MGSAVPNQDRKKATKRRRTCGSAGTCYESMAVVPSLPCECHFLPGTRLHSPFERACGHLLNSGCHAPSMHAWCSLASTIAEKHTVSHPLYGRQDISLNAIPDSSLVMCHRRGNVDKPISCFILSWWQCVPVSQETNFRAVTCSYVQTPTLSRRQQLPI